MTGGWEPIRSRGHLVYWRRRLPSGAYFAVAHNNGTINRPDDGRWTWALRGPDLGPTGGYTIHATGTRSSSALARAAADRFLHERPCSTCTGPCSWTEDAWVCRRCGDEWDPDSGEPYDLFPEEAPAP